MKSKQEVIENLSSLKDVLKEKYGVTHIAIFGSYSREDYNQYSDVDIIVEFEKPIGYKYFELADYLESILQCKVDLFTYNAIKQKPLLWESVKEDIVHV